MNFLKNVLASILGFFISIGLLFFVFLILISALSTIADNSSVVKVKDNSVLEIDFTKELTDYGERIFLEDFDYTIENYNGLNVVVKAIEIAKTDDKIKGISLKSTGKIGGLATASALRTALIDFKKSGKFVYAFNDIIGQTDYYLQSVADSIFLSPVGNIDFRGLSAEVLFFKEAQEKSGFSMEVIRHGKYKSAVEPFLSDKMSEENREQISELLHSLWETMANDIAKSRNITTDDLNVIANELKARTPQLALQAKLIDGIIYQDQFEQILVENMQVEDIKDINFINIEKYAESVVNKASLNRPKNKIAVIFAEGQIQYGRGNVGVIGNETIIKSLRQARQDDDIKAIVLRINSPGGSALASELMHREIEITKKYKNVYVSMGNYAASGGYYIACNANKIYAEKGTITGSIGVFGMLPNMHKLAEKIGINAEHVQTHENALEYSIFEAPTENFIKVTTESVADFYNTFVERVARGRKMSIEQVDAIAQGRVWSGIQAQQHNLVDEIGGLNEAIGFAAQEYGLEEYDIKIFPINTLNFTDFVKNLKVNAQNKAIKQEIGSLYSTYTKFRNLTNSKGVQAHMLWEIKID